MDQLVLVFLMALAAILAEPLGRRIGVASPVLMTLFGLVLALDPDIPDIHLKPELILPLVLPPLLHAAARRTSWRQFASNWAQITRRAFLLVIVTAVAVAWAFHSWYPALPLAAAVALGAMVAPPDPVAAIALASRLGLPRRLTSVLEGEGLFNDVTAVVIYAGAVETVLAGAFSAKQTLMELATAALVAIGVGLALGWGTAWLMRHLRDTSGKVALSLLVPFGAYSLADAWRGSGVLAVLVCSLYLSEAATSYGDRAFRVVSDAFWEIIEMLVSGFAFGLIGLELATVLHEVGSRWPRMLGSAAVVIAVVVGVRLVWLLGTWWLFARRRTEPDGPQNWRETIVTWWAGMRGVATVALALALPFTLDDGAPFPGRAEILFIAFAVVLFTLLVQGPTLPLVVRWTCVHANTQRERDLELQLWHLVRQVELERAEVLAFQENLSTDTYEQLRDLVQRRLARAYPHVHEDDPDGDDGKQAERSRLLRRLMTDIVSTGQQELLAMRSSPTMPPDLVDRVLHHLDVYGGPPR
ncbi:Na+/H+ antiporter [Actinomadura rupiterrae]|uniref:Na+/H+ antiporter n=1 Tax=Actinomadura rupiterrae TaxID=559627 RepID=UPI0020A51C9A|nr:Na+/H+ antiporter [Actinomadura rupiterrae]MCP2342093.1 CPA1 family monovalent cation:H+ antiporter [Actinomadura rupiterrae]